MYLPAAIKFYSSLLWRWNNQCVLQLRVYVNKKYIPNLVFAKKDEKRLGPGSFVCSCCFSDKENNLEIKINQFN